MMNTGQAKNAFIKTIAMALLCFVSGFFGAWAAYKSTSLDGGLSGADLSNKREVISQEGEVYAAVARKVSPSVVSIVTESQEVVGFREYTQQAAGTGVIISTDGYILTNRHVINGASDVHIVLSDGTAYDDVEIVGADPANDIAFLKINGVKDLPVAKLGDSTKMDVGEKVVAIGNALGQYQTSVTTGIISGVGRPLVAGGEGDSEQLTNLFQTDAAINPGNSGGPLVNLDGEVIGINTAIDQSAQGIGFAIPINDAKGLIKTVIKKGVVERSYLGVSYIMLTKEIAKQKKLSVNEGAFISTSDGGGVSPGSPADNAGLKAGDIIVKVEGENVGSSMPLLSAISVHAPDEKITLTYLRDGKEKTVEVTLGSFPTEL